MSESNEMPDAMAVNNLLQSLAGGQLGVGPQMPPELESEINTINEDNDKVTLKWRFAETVFMRLVTSDNEQWDDGDLKTLERMEEIARVSVIASQVYHKDLVLGAKPDFDAIDVRKKAAEAKIEAWKKSLPQRPRRGGNHS